MPSRRALAFIMSAKPSIEPPTPSAIVTAMSFADFTISIFSALSTVTVVPTLKPILVGCWPAAFFETVSRVLNENRPSLIARNVVYAVISLVTEAGYHGYVAFSACSTLPVEASISSCASAWARDAPASAKTAATAKLSTKGRRQNVIGRGPVNCLGLRKRLGSIGGNCKLSKRRMGGKGRALPSLNHGDLACIANHCDQSSAGGTSMTAAIVGWAHTPFGKLNDESVESLIVRVAGEALSHAGVAPKDVDEIVLGHFNAGFSEQDFTAALVLPASPELRFKRATRVQNACATGSAAVHQGVKAIAGHSARIVLVVGVERMTATPAPEIGRNLLKASYVREEAEIDGGFAGIFGKIASLYFQKWGDQSDALAMIADKNHKNGVGNPYAQMRKDLGYEFCRTESEKNPFVAGPLKRTDCSLVSDGVAVVVFADVETALRLGRAVVFRAAEHVQDFLPMSKRDILKFEGCAQAWQRALQKAGLVIGELSFVETHDCFTVAELIEYEAMGLTPQGQGARAIKEGWTQKDGKLPVNPSGGLKAKGHPIGATGVSMHALTAMQLTDNAGDLQVKNAHLGGIFNMGGAAVANYVSILERIK